MSNNLLLDSVKSLAIDGDQFKLVLLLEVSSVEI